MLFVVQAPEPGLDLPAWAADNRDLIDARVLDHRAVLFRGFDVKTAAVFHTSSEMRVSRRPSA